MAVSKISAEGYNLTSAFLFSNDSNSNQNVFEIPLYQRPYVWKKDNWKALFDDIIENDRGYFIGAIICINHGADESNKYIRYEVVDGQQRLTTLSLFLAAIYKELVDCKKTLDDKIKQDLREEKISLEEYTELVKKNTDDFENLKRSLMVSSGGGKFKTRVLPQNKDNIDDYFLAFIDAGLIDKKAETLDYTEEINKKSDGRRLHLIAKAYEYFKERVVEYAKGDTGNDTIKQFNRILEILSKVNSSYMVLIVADSNSSANVLFETLNNRGTPLTITDLIKNRLLAELDNKFKDNKKDFKKYSQQLINIINGVTKKGNKEISAGEQERFFRHGYNAFRTEWNYEWNLKYPSDDKEKKPFPVGKRANLYKSYVKMIVFNPVKVFEQIQTCAKIYPIIQGNSNDKNISISTSLQETYKDLNRINGTTGYTLLLYLVKNRVSLKIDDDKYFKDICELLIKFFVRHTFTDTPPSNTLDNSFITFIDEIEKEKYTGDLICENLKRILKNAYNDDNDEIFKSRLRGDVYANDAIRFVLVKLAESYHQKEALTLWNKEHNKNKNEFYTWTIEHILPQTIKSKKEDSLGEDWIKMLANGDEAKALEIQADNVNKLGNLTLTVSNTELGNKPFAEKKTMKGGYSDSILAGSLNAYVCNQTVWGAKQIQERTELLIKKILEIFDWEKKTKK